MARLMQNAARGKRTGDQATKTTDGAGSAATAKTGVLSHGGFEDSGRGRILAAAAHLFRANGFERTTVRDLATAVGIQSGSIFHHFKSKEEILRQVMVEVILFNTERMRAALAGATSARERVLALIYCELQSINGETGEAMAVLIYEWRSLSAQGQQEILKLRGIYEQMWLDILQEAKEEGLIHPHVDIAILRRFLTGALSWSNYWYHPDGTLNIKDIAEQALHLVVNNRSGA